MQAEAIRVPDQHRPAFRPRSRKSGFTLTEVIVVIAVVGVLAAIAIPQIGGVLGSSKSAIASNLLETLNGAVHRFNQTNYELVLTGKKGDGAEELLILRSLQYRNPANPKPGSPYMRSDWNPAVSKNKEDYRLMWTGTTFKLVVPGKSGAGLKVDFDGADIGVPYEFPAGYTTVGQ
jgi:prepilin-type N-terminal cleavage/methylation domain-containing protein